MIARLVYSSALALLLAPVPARAQAAIHQDLYRSLWSADGARAARSNLVEWCQVAPTDLQATESLAQNLTQLARVGDWQASFLWYLRRAGASKADQYRSLSEEDRQVLAGMIDCRGAEEADLACS
jgi:hypothetical protein